MEWLYKRGVASDGSGFIIRRVASHASGFIIRMVASDWEWLYKRGWLYTHSIRGHPSYSPPIIKPLPSEATLPLL
jgi:hypothetical protein